MAKKKNPQIENALSLKPKSSIPKKPIINNQDIEKATQDIHKEQTSTKGTKQEVKKTSLHIPMELYIKLKRKSFDRGITLRKLIIETLEKEVWLFN